ncbi:MAG: PAS domain-containing protein [Armatimonadetes bacterium]|nr:PAS domain-containing protein [Armatimonadota bacterium]
MKQSFTSKIRVIILLMFLITLIQGIILLKLITNFDNIITLKMNIQNTVIITIFVQFVLAMVLIFYIPVFLRKAFADIHQILKEISMGNYHIDIDLENFRKSMDNEFFAVILSISNMLSSVFQFDILKKDKIVEHHNRIISVLHLAENGFIILDLEGNIIYINDVINDVFPAISEKSNMINTNFPPEIENNVKKYIIHVLNAQTKQEFQQYFIPSLKHHITLNSAIVRDSNGEPKGAVIAFSNLKKVIKKPSSDNSE